MKKQAYLIIAHKQLELLHKLIESLDYEYNDVFVHIDKKTTVNFEDLNDCTTKSKVYFFQEYDVKWGRESQVAVEMLLFQKAYNQGEYSYYHLMSGQDLPIKPIEEIYRFFNDKEVEFLEFGKDDHLKYRFRLGDYHYNGKSSCLKHAFSLANIINTKLGKDRITRYQLKVYKGSNWASLTNRAVKELIEHKKLIKKITRWTLCPDEVYKQTLLKNSKIIFAMNTGEDIRYIDWEHHEGTSPHTLRVWDYEKMISLNCMFARKFDLEIDKNIIQKILTINNCLVHN